MATIALPPEAFSFALASYRDSGYAGLTAEDLSPIALQSFGGPVPSSLQALQQQLEQFRQQLTTSDALLKTTGPKNYENAIQLLELALTKVYKIAVFVRGDYDARGADEATKKTLFVQSVQAFGSCEKAAAFGLSQLSGIQTQVRVIEISPRTFLGGIFSC